MVHLLSIFVLHVYLFNMYNCIWFSVKDYFYVLYIFVVLLVYYKSIMDFFFLSFIYLCYFFVLYIYIYIYIETHCHIFMAINTKLVIGHYIWKNIPSLKSTKLHHTYDRKTEEQYGAKKGQKLHQSAPWTPLILIEASSVHYLWPNALSLLPSWP